MSPVGPGQGVDASLPGGALRLDVNPSEQSSAVLVGSDGVRVQPQWGCEARMVGKLAALPYIQFSTTVAGLIFGEVTVDESELTDLPQANAQDGTFTAYTDGFYEVGVQTMMSIGVGAAIGHWELAVYSDMGFSGIDVSPAAPNQFGVANLAYGVGWQRIAQRAHGFTAAQSTALPTVPDAQGFPLTCSTVWCVKTPPSGLGVGSSYPFSTPAPTRFRFGLRCELLTNVFGSTPEQTYAWFRYLGPTP